MKRRQPGAFQQLGDAPFTLGTLLPEQATKEIDILKHRQGHV